MHSLLKNANFDVVENAAAAGQTALTSDSVDMADHEAVTFVLPLEVIDTGGVATMKLQGSDDNGSADDFSDLEGTAVANSADTDDNKLLISEAVKPVKRYIRAVVARATGDVTTGSLIAIRTGARKVPVTQGTSVEASESHVSPDEGTA